MSESPPVRKKTIHPLRDAILAATLTFMTSAVGLSILYIKARDAQLQAVRGELLQLARTTAAQVDGDLVRGLTSPIQEGSPEHLRALEPLRRMHHAATDVVFVYTGVMIKHRIFWILDSKYGEPVAAGEDGPDPIMTEYFVKDPELVRAFEEQVPIADLAPVKEPTRTLLSAFAPIYDHAGKFVGILGVDMVLDAVEARMAVIRRAFFIGLLAVLALSVIAGAVALRLRRFAAAIVSELRAARIDAEASASAAQAATREKAEFLAMMSHEIRTPMNGMLGVADLLRNMTPDPKQKKLIDILTASGSSLLRLINDILDFSKIEAERLELRLKPFELQSLFDELEHLLGAHARTKQVTLKIDVAPDLPIAVNGDRQRLSQVLLNLGTNAVKFTDRGEVTIRVRLVQALAGKTRLEFTVTDTGIGMDAVALGRLFTPFTQLATSQRHRGGTGLGLVIAQKLVSLMGGIISVRSELTKGSTFSFVIGLPAAEMASATTTIGVMRLEVLSILVAEDNMVNQTIVEAMLRQLGHRTTLVGTGAAALEALARADFDLVLMDCNMPEMDGLTATRSLRAGGVRDPNIPVIALTANAMDGDRELCLAAGMNDFVTKPLTIAELRKAIERVREIARAVAA